MDIQKIISDLVGKLTGNADLIAKFKSDPLAIVKDLLGIDLDPSMLDDVVKGVTGQLGGSAAKEAGGATLNYGTFITVVINFLLMAIVIFLLVRSMNKLHDKIGKKKEEENRQEQTEKQLQKVMIDIKNKYGKNAILNGMNLQEAGTTIDRNNQLGGHRS